MAFTGIAAPVLLDMLRCIMSAAEFPVFVVCEAISAVAGIPPAVATRWRETGLLAAPLVPLFLARDVLG